MKDLKSLITVEEAREMHENWIKSRGAILDKYRGKPDCRDFVFSVADLKKYLDHISSTSTMANPGIRIHFGAYGPTLEDEVTVFMCATKGVSGDAETDYDIQPINKGWQGFPPIDF